MIGYVAIGQFALSFLIIVLFSPVPLVFASDLFEADSYFQQANYPLARKAYQQAANVGSAHAFYQLGLMEYKGLGGAEDPIKALVWFNLAAEQKFNDSEAIVESLLALVPAENKSDVVQLITSFREQYGTQYMLKQYYPLIKPDELKRKIYFAEEGQTEQTATTSYQYVDTLDFDREQDDIQEAEKQLDEGSIGPSMIFPRARAIPIWKRAYSAVVDYDVAEDGSARNLETSQEIGYYRPALSELKLYGGPAPHFADSKVPFVKRAQLGLSGYTRAKLLTETYQGFYYALIRKARKYRKSEAYEDQYRLALLLMNFPWLAENDKEVDTVLTSLSESGFPLAQYEYGAKLYREQTDIAKGIYWLSEASKYGVAKAEYRLGRILLDSPWVEEDENKALFWFSAAAENGHEIAGLKAVELKLLAKNKDLHDVAGAADYLTGVAESQSNNPEYAYLLAILNYSNTPRDLPLAVQHIRRAMSLADNFSWDTTQWQQLLTSWTSGGTVTIVEP